MAQGGPEILKQTAVPLCKTGIAMTKGMYGTRYTRSLGIDFEPCIDRTETDPARTFFKASYFSQEDRTRRINTHGPHVFHDGLVNLKRRVHVPTLPAFAATNMHTEEIFLQFQIRKVQSHKLGSPRARLKQKKKESIITLPSGRIPWDAGEEFPKVRKRQRPWPSVWCPWKFQVDGRIPVDDPLGHSE